MDRHQASEEDYKEEQASSGEIYFTSEERGYSSVLSCRWSSRTPSKTDVTDDKVGNHGYWRWPKVAVPENSATFIPRPNGSVPLYMRRAKMVPEERNLSYNLRQQQQTQDCCRNTNQSVLDLERDRAAFWYYYRKGYRNLVLGEWSDEEEEAEAARGKGSVHRFSNPVGNNASENTRTVFTEDRKPEEKEIDTRDEENWQFLDRLNLVDYSEPNSSSFEDNPGSYQTYLETQGLYNPGRTLCSYSAGHSGATEVDQQEEYPETYPSGSGFVAERYDKGQHWNEVEESHVQPPVQYSSGYLNLGPRTFPTILEVIGNRYRSHGGIEFLLPPENQRTYECVFCKGNESSMGAYQDHAVRTNGRVSCPFLRKKVCKICHATGDDAHTPKYCPDNPVGIFKNWPVDGSDPSLTHRARSVPLSSGSTFSNNAYQARGAQEGQGQDPTWTGRSYANVTSGSAGQWKLGKLGGMQTQNQYYYRSQQKN